jgi:hypothetical protein
VAAFTIKARSLLRHRPQVRLRKIRFVSNRTTSVVIQSITRACSRIARAGDPPWRAQSTCTAWACSCWASRASARASARSTSYTAATGWSDDAVEIRRYPSGAWSGGGRDDPLLHGAAGHRDHQHQAPLRRLGGAGLQVRRARHRAAALGPTKYDRLGLDGETYTILERAVPLLRLPVASGRNLALLIEIAARNELLKSQGYDAAKEFARRVDEEIAKNARAEGGRRP